MPTKIITLPLSISNAYLLLGDRPVLIDAGAPKDGDRLVAALRQHSITPKDLSLIALTHGHTDHTGAVAAVAAGGAPVAISATDAPLLQSGANGVLPPNGPAGVMLRPLVRRTTFTGFIPQIQLKGPQRLDDYGVGAEMVPVGGHTPGSFVVLLDDGTLSSAISSEAASPAAASAPATHCDTSSPRTVPATVRRCNASSITTRPSSWSDTADRWPRPTSGGGSMRSPNPTATGVSGVRACRHVTHRPSGTCVTPDGEHDHE